MTDSMGGTPLPTPEVRMRDRIAGIAVPSVAGTVGAVVLIGLYIGLVTAAQGLSHARELIQQDWYFVVAIAGGFGMQVGLFVHLRRLLSGRARGSAGAVSAAGTGTSTAAMLACCAHHVTEALPFLGISSVAIFLNDYRLPVMAMGIAVNGAGVLFMLRLVLIERRYARREGSCSVVY